MIKAIKKWWLCSFIGKHKYNDDFVCSLCGKRFIVQMRVDYPDFAKVIDAIEMEVKRG